MNDAMATGGYPMMFEADYPEGDRNRLTVLLRPILAIPIMIVLMLSGATLLAPLLMIVFRQKYPEWMFRYNLELTKFNLRFTAYAFLLTDVYPSTDDEQSARFDVAYPNVERDLNRWLPLIKWLLAIPHIILLTILGLIVLVVTFIAWLVIIITGQHPRSLFDFVVGVVRYSYRVQVYAALLTTDRYPPFSLK